jgi:hypothetical protein
VSGDETAEVRVLDLADLPYADDIADDESTARVLVDLPLPGSDTRPVSETPEKTINIQQGGIVSRVRVKLKAAGGSWAAAKWRIVRQDGTLAIRVDITSSPQQTPNLPLSSESEPGPTPEEAARWILWVVLERNQARDSTVPPRGGPPDNSDASLGDDNVEVTQVIHLPIPKASADRGRLAPHVRDGIPHAPIFLYAGNKSISDYLLPPAP